MPSKKLFKPFEFSLDKPDFDHNDIDRQLEEGRINGVDAVFLHNLVKKHAIDYRILFDATVYRKKLSDGLQPGRDLFVKMQKLGCKNHPLTDLDISDYKLPDIDLRYAQIGGDLPNP